MLATVAGLTAASGNGQGGPLVEISDRARQMVTTLDEIVWAMNPKHDSLTSLVSYSCLYADRLLKLANITCQLKGAVDLPGRTVSSVLRHEFFLAFKEAITNVIPPLWSHRSPAGLPAHRQPAAAVHCRQWTRAGGGHRCAGRQWAGQHAGAAGEAGRTV